MKDPIFHNENLQAKWTSLKTRLDRLQFSVDEDPGSKSTNHHTIDVTANGGLVACFDYTYLAEAHEDCEALKMRQADPLKGMSITEAEDKKVLDIIDAVVAGKPPKIKLITAKLKNRRVWLRRNDVKACPQHGPWALGFRRIVFNADAEQYTFIKESTERVGSHAVCAGEIHLTEEAMRALFTLWIAQHPIGEAETLLHDAIAEYHNITKETEI